MLDPIRLTTDLFKEKNLSDGSLRAFADEFLIRLSNPENNPGGIYNNLLMDTTTLYQNYYGTLVTQLTEKANSKGVTITVNDAFDAVIEKLSALQGLIKFLFSEGSGVYQEFFPQGMKQYHHVSLSRAETLFIRFRAIATIHLLSTHPAEVAELNTRITNYVNAWQQKETLGGVIDASTTTRHQQRKALTLQLTRCFLIIASNNLEKPDRFDNYYEKRHLPIRKGKKKAKVVV